MKVKDPVCGMEIEPEKAFCRVYPTPEGMKGWPTVEMLREKLHTLDELVPRAILVLPHG